MRGVGRCPEAWPKVCFRLLYLVVSDSRVVLAALQRRDEPLPYFDTFRVVKHVFELLLFE